MRVGAIRLPGLVMILCVSLAPGRLAAQLGWVPQANEADLLRRIAENPEHAPHYLDAADWFFERRRLDDAEEMLVRAQELLGRQSALAGGPGTARPARGRGPLPMNPMLYGPPPNLLDVAPPAPARPITLTYTPEAGEAGLGGLAVLQADVRPNGSVASVRTVSAQPASLEGPVVAALRAARFEPTRLDGPLQIDVLAFVSPSDGSVQVQILPSARQLTGYMAAARELVRTHEAERAMVVVAAALRAIERERVAPGRATVATAGSNSRLQLSPTVQGRAVRSEGAMPAYPADLRAAGAGAAVGLSVVVDAEGRVVRVEMLQGVTDLEAASIAAVREWRFVPAHADGVPIPQIVPVTLVFVPETGEVTDQLRAGVGNIQAPRKIRDVRPRYPQDARQAGEHGTVILSATIGTDGAVRDAVVMRSVSARLDAAAVEAVLQWRFEPTRINDVPIEIAMTVTVNFAVREQR